MPFCGYLPYFSPVCMRRIILCPHKIGTTTISGFIKEKGSLETLPGATNGLVDDGYYGCYPVLDRKTKYNNDFDKSRKNTYGDVSKTGKVFFRTYDRVSNALPFDHLIMIEHTTFSDENLSSKVVYSYWCFYCL